jgi:hypothetical protein
MSDDPNKISNDATDERKAAVAEIQGAGEKDIKEKPGTLGSIATVVQIVAVVIGVVFSIWSFNDARDKEVHAREMEAENLRLELQKPFIELRQARYTEMVKLAAILADPEYHAKDEIDHARKRFRELYIAELSMVEDPNVEHAMMSLAADIDPTLFPLKGAQEKAYDLSHALRDSFTATYHLKDD